MIAERRHVALDDLRRTYGTEMARSEVPIPIHVLCGYMGHSNMETTKEFYLAADERDAETVRAALAALCSGFKTVNGRSAPVPVDSRVG